MSEDSELLRELEQFTPRNWAIQSANGRTLVVIEATNAVIAAKRVALLVDDIPKLPRHFKVTAHEGPTRTAWFSDGWFRIRELGDPAVADSVNSFH